MKKKWTEREARVARAPLSYNHTERQASSVKRLMQVYGDAWKPILERHNAFQWNLACLTRRLTLGAVMPLDLPLQRTQVPSHLMFLGWPPCVLLKIL